MGRVTGRSQITAQTTHLSAVLERGHVAQQGLVQTAGPEEGGVNEVRTANRAFTIRPLSIQARMRTAQLDVGLTSSRRARTRRPGPRRRPSV